MTFYQDEKRDNSRPSSSDGFKVILSEIIIGCVPSFDNFLKEFLQTDIFLNSGDSASPMYEGTDSKDSVIDYMIDIPLASYILYDLFVKTKDVHFNNQIDLRIMELNEAVGPRTGEHVIKSY